MAWWNRRRSKGPFRLPQTLAWYANANFGIGKPTGTPRANIMARDAAVAADPTVTFGPYDNDGNGFVDAFIVIHAGSGGEQSGNSGDIWSHKWTLPDAYTADTTKIYAYLTVPEDSRIGVCAHELGICSSAFPICTTPTTPPKVSATGASWPAARGMATATSRLTPPPGARQVRVGRRSPT